MCNESVWVGFQPNFYLLCVVCLQRLYEGKSQRMQFMSAMRRKADNLHTFFQSSVYHLDIPRMRRVAIQYQDIGIFFKRLHKTDKIFEPLRKAVFLDPSSLVTSCYWTWWNAVQEFSIHVVPRKHQKRRNIHNGGIHAGSNCYEWVSLCWRQGDPSLTLKGNNFACFMLNDSEARIFIDK